MPPKKIIKFIAQLLIILFAFLSPFKLFAQDLPITVESGIIPPEFNLNNDTLIIASTGNPFYGSYMKRHFKNDYTSQFIIAKPEGHSIDNCRFVLYEGTTNTTITKIGGPEAGRSRNMVGHGSFYIVDRKTNTKYINPNLASPKLIKAYVTGLDEARKK